MEHEAHVPTREDARARRAYLQALRPRHFPHVGEAFQVRWNDQDAYAHANNGSYTEWADHAINAYLHASTGFAPPSGVDGHVGLAVETRTAFLGQVSFPQRVRVAVGTARIGTSAVTYRCGVFADADVAGDAAPPRAVVDFTHAFVSADDLTTVVPLSARMRAALAAIAMRDGGGGGDGTGGAHL